MPELPEVETIARSLLPKLVGRRIQTAHLLWERTLAEPDPQEFMRRIAEQVICSVGRRGKFLVFSLSHDTLLLHLRMSGDILVEPSDIPPAVHHRLLVDLDNGQRLAFTDTRKFGRAWLVKDPNIILGGLGPEPLDETLTAADFYQRLHLFQRQLKPLMLDQGFLAGLGNIYTDEALYLARLNPLTTSNTLNQEQAARLLQSIRQVLEEGIRRNGASIDWVYRGGDFQNYFCVYQRTGQPCPRCGTPVQRILVGQRSTHFCPACQPA